MESVFAEPILALMSSGESVIRMRDFSDLCDLDIFDVGSLSDITLWTGATSHKHDVVEKEAEAYGSEFEGKRDGFRRLR